MTRLFTLAAELRASGVEPRHVTLTIEDEEHLSRSAEATFGPAAAEAVTRGSAAWRAYLTAWLANTVKLEIAFDAPTTSVR